MQERILWLNTKQVKQCTDQQWTIHDDDVIIICTFVINVIRTNMPGEFETFELFCILNKYIFNKQFVREIFSEGIQITSRFREIVE